MKKLENFGVQELNSGEIMETHGGLSTFKPYVFTGLIHAVTDFVDGAIDRFNMFR